MSIITDIQNKPHEYKVRLIWSIVIGVVVILVLFWVLVTKMGENFGKASGFFKEQSKTIQDSGQKLYEENK
jgi:Sec-independent protein translocase protein TatA